ncbi:hypothetical protein PLICRDRAFT_41108 [Plicaturopsis crispa FD-325 SS-3]|nr:hypothetical protein PLICRDRAFT_41108 [Plicaturopsis crispa FD-325 SS-3]
MHDQPQPTTTVPQTEHVVIPSSAGTENVPRLPTGIGHLPTELLYAIFRQVFWLAREEVGQMAHSPSTAEQTNSSNWHGNLDLHSPSLFPYAISNVCRLWRDIMADVPMYWTRLVVYAGSAETTNPSIQSQLRWSGDLPFSFTVIRRERDNSDLPDLERAHMAAIMALLKPHVHHACMIQFNALYSTSLPPLRGNLVGTASQLYELRLESELSGDGIDVCANIDTNATLFFRCPHLRTLDLDGNNFRDAVKHQWLKSFGDVHGIIVSRLEDPISLKDSLSALQMLHKLMTLELRNIAFSLDTPPQPDTIHFPGLSYITFDHLDGDAVQVILRSINDAHYSEVVIAECSLSRIRDPNFDWAHRLFLRDIGSEEALIPFLLRWSSRDVNSGPYELSFKRCPSFTNSTLRSMSTGGAMNDHWVCPALTDIEVIECHNFSAKYLRRMVRMRQNASDMQDTEDDTLPGDNDIVSYIETVTISGCGPILTEKDQDWFRSNLDGFYYSV